MKLLSIGAVAEVRAARELLCDRFGNDPRCLPRTCAPSSAIIVGALSKARRNPNRRRPCAKRPARKKKTAVLRYGINDIRLFYENDARFLKQF